MTNLRNVTAVVMVTTILAAIVYDIFARVYGGTPATISDITLSAATQVPLIALAVGALCGHFFWPKRAGDPWATVLVCLPGVLLYFAVPTLGAFLLGLAAGHQMFWQRPKA